MIFNEMNPILFNVLMGVVIIAVMLVTTYLIPCLKASVQDTKYENLLDTVEKAVKAAEQKIKESGQGKAKKAQVLAYVSYWLAEHHIMISEEQLDTLIEAAVWAMNKEK